MVVTISSPFVMEGNLIKGITLPAYSKALPTLMRRGLYKVRRPGGPDLVGRLRIRPTTTMLSYLQNDSHNGGHMDAF